MIVVKAQICSRFTTSKEYREGIKDPYLRFETEADYLADLRFANDLAHDDNCHGFGNGEIDPGWYNPIVVTVRPELSHDEYQHSER